MISSVIVRSVIRETSITLCSAVRIVKKSHVLAFNNSKQKKAEQLMYVGRGKWGILIISTMRSIPPLFDLMGTAHKQLLEIGWYMGNSDATAIFHTSNWAVHKLISDLFD